MDQNWTYEETKKTILTALVVDGKDSVSLDVSRSDWRNTQEVAAWARQLGYDAEADDASESVRVRKRDAEDPDGPASEAVNARNDLLDAWLEQPDDKFETTIRIAMQRSARAKRDVPADRTYWTGYTAGYADALAALFRERLRRKAIQDMLDRNLEDCPAIESALRYLYARKISRPHPEMAEALSVTYGALAEAMKPILLADAAEAYRTGRNTRYALTPAGRRFCRDVLAADDGNDAGRALSGLRDEIAAIRAAMSGNGSYPDGVTAATAEEDLARYEYVAGQLDAFLRVPTDPEHDTVTESFTVPYQHGHGIHRTFLPSTPRRQIAAWFADTFAIDMTGKD